MFSRGKASPASPSTPAGHPSSFYDAEAVALWQRLGIDPTKNNNGPYSPMDAVYKHPTGGGTLYIGNQTAAQNLNMLKGKGVAAVVNCTHGMGAIPNYHENTLDYYRFPISDWRSMVDSTPESVLAFVAPLWKFLDNHISKGNSVLVHCLAGAHRAGTTGCAILIHYGRLDAATAIKTAQGLRPIISPICDFPSFLRRLEAAEKILPKEEANK